MQFETSLRIRVDNEHDFYEDLQHWVNCKKLKKWQVYATDHIEISYKDEFRILKSRNAPEGLFELGEVYSNLDDLAALALG